MKYVYILFHSYEINDCEEIKILGVHSSEELAKMALEKYKILPGFDKYPDDFHIDKYEIDLSKWIEGFITWDEA